MLIGIAAHFQTRHGLAALKPLEIHLALRIDLDLEPFGKRVDDRRTHAVQAAGYLIPAAAELAAGMEHGKYYCDGRKPGRLLDPYRDTAAVIRHRNDIARQNTDVDLIAEARKGLVDRVVYNLIDKMMQAPFAGGAYVHARTLAHRLQALENLYLITAVILGCLSNFAKIQ